MQKIMFYCQHVLGMGHLIRSMALVRGLQTRFEVCFLNGGEIVPGFEFPEGVKVVNLPPIKSDENFKEMQAVNGEGLAETQAARTRILLDEFEQFQPEAVIIELYPFGRRKFSFELLPLLARIRLAGKKTKVICSLRDILVKRPDPEKSEGRAVMLMNHYFDALLIHADPRFQRLEETFGKAEALRVETIYTGYVTQPTPALTEAAEPELEAAAGGVPLILASIGGGRVGVELLAAAIEASDILKEKLPHRLLVFGGPYLPEAQFAQLQALAADKPQVTLKPYTTQFPAYMKQAVLSVSMAGYNTCMDVAAAGARALMLPFAGGNNDEQTIRAEKLEKMGVVGMLRPGDLQPARLAEIMAQRLQAEPAAMTLDTKGVEATTAFVAGLLARPELTASVGPLILLPHQKTEDDVLATELRPALERLEEAGGQVNIFLRDDDADEDEETLRHLLDVCFALNTPVNLEVIPARLTQPGIQLLKSFKDARPELVELDQHGWQHLSHEAVGRNCEFGPRRAFAQQLEDIASGKALLEATFGERFFPAFTPPWNRCTEDTLRVLDQLGFAVFSKDRDGAPAAGYGFAEISITLDLYRWKGGAAMKPPAEIVRALLRQIAEGVNPIGLLLHHKVMDAEAFYFLEQLLAELNRHSGVQFHTFQSLLQLTARLGAVGKIAAQVGGL